MCELELTFAGASGAAAVLIKGRIDGPCEAIDVKVTLSSAATVQAQVDVPGTGLRDWSATIGVDDATLIDAACKQGRVLVGVQCIRGGQCEKEFDQPFVCCPQVALNRLDFGDCVQGPQGGFSPVQVEIALIWPENYAEDVQVSLVLRPADPPHVPVTTAVVNCSPDQAIYTQADFVSAADGPLYIAAGFDYEVVLRIVQPERCATELPISHFGVPACECEPLPGLGQLIAVFDAAGNEIADIHSVDCLDSPTVRLVPTQPATGWEVAGDPDGQSIAVAADGSEATVTLPEDGTVAIVLVTFGIGSCRSTVPVSVRRCVSGQNGGGDGGGPGPGPGPGPGDGNGGGGGGGDGGGDGGGLPNFCDIFRFLVLLGLGIAVLGLVILLCPVLMAPVVPAQYALAIGGGLLAVGLLVLILGLALWALFGCPSGRCDWLQLGWQAAFIAGAILIYAGFCPGCSWMLAGFLLWAVAVWLFFEWRRRCDPSVCKQLAELLFVMIAFDVAGLLEMALGFCVLASNPILAAAWAVFVAGFNVAVYLGLRRYNCLAP